MAIPELGPADAVVAVDVQNDFCPGGALPVRGGDEVAAVLNRWIERARRGSGLVVASRDWHPPQHMSFLEQGGPWPAHCIQGSHGARFHPGLHLPAQAWIISKGADPQREQYSALEGTGLAERLRARGIRRLWVGGLALDVCVRATVMDALAEGFEVHLIAPATRAVEALPGDGERALAEMRAGGAVIEPEEAGDG